MFYIDTHCHIDFDWFDEDRDQMLEKVKAANVNYLINIGCEKRSNEKVKKNSERYDNVFFSSGIHPSDVDEADDTVFDQMKEFSKNPKMVAIGEIGLDYFKYDNDRNKQKYFFEKAIETAHELNKPIVVHNREADQDMYDILKSSEIEKIGGVLHCFSSPVDVAEKMIDIGMHLSFTGNITFKNSKLSDSVRLVPLDRLMLETDSPFLTPHPNRGKRNDPSYIPVISDKVAEIRGITTKEVMESTTSNALKFFNLKI
jgi:TatD DNase family protein